jgi:hypothetical protein
VERPLSQQLALRQLWPSPSGSGDLTIFANNATLLTIQGITAGIDGQHLRIYSIGAGQVDLVHQSGSASAALRLVNFATSGNTSLAAGAGTADYVYDTTAARWRLLTHDQGAWITPTYAGGNYTAATGTWTVDSGDVTTQAYFLRGRTLTVTFYLVTTSVSATPASLSIGNAAWGSFTITKTVLTLFLNNDNGVGNAVGFIQLNAAGTTIPLSKITGTWATATNATNVFGTIMFEVN